MKMKRLIKALAAFSLGAVIAVSAFPAVSAASGFKTNLTGVKYVSGSWSEGAGGLSASGSGDCFAMSETEKENFSYETKVTINSGAAASLVFRSNTSGNNAYVANVDLARGDARIFKFTGSGATTLGTYTLPDATLREYTLRVEAYESSLRYFLNGQLIISCEDSQFKSGRLGLLICNSQSVFEYANYSDLLPNGVGSLELDGAELSPVFSSDVYNYTANVDYETASVRLSASAASRSKLALYAYSGGKQTFALEEFTAEAEIPLEEGMNYITVSPTVTGVKGVSTVIKIERAQNPANYYTETYRPQYHITPESGWLNDPNGMVYYNGQYHFFYQYDGSTKFPGHEKWWAHVVSTDMVHWEERPVALAPDDFGSIWSGSAVVDTNNSSGLFNETGSGLIAYYTNAGRNGVGQRQCMAYSVDGDNWIKYNGGAPVIDSDDDPAHHGDFRDPKVFYHEESGKWMMIVAGGPVRFYSSENLIDWTLESYSTTIYTECPDFYELAVDGDGGKTKWVLSGAGVWYMTGDFKQVNGKWDFVPDTGEKLDFNFGRDAYAGQTFSDIPGRRIMVEWMVDVGYPYDVGKITDPWNGAMTLPYELGLKTVDGKTVLTQKPIAELDSLRLDEYNFDGAIINAGDYNPLCDLSEKTYEIDTVIDAADAGGFGFKLCIGNGQYTTVNYNAAAQKITVDRTKSGANANSGFAEVFSANAPLDNGKLKLKIYVDSSSIEVFVNDGEAICTALIFPDDNSCGMSLYCESGSVKAEKLSVYPLSTIYRAESSVGATEDISLVTDKTLLSVGDSSELWLVAEPLGGSFAAAEWSVSDDSILKITKTTDGGAFFTALKAGKATVKAACGALSDEIEITVSDGFFKTNLTGFVAAAGSWGKTPDGIVGAGGGNSPLFSATKSADFTYSADVTYNSGYIGTALIFRSSEDNSAFYAADINESTRSARILKFHRDPVSGSSSDVTLGSAYTFQTTENHKYNLKVETSGTTLKFYVNGVLAVETTDSELKEGGFGLNVCGASAVFQNVIYTDSALEQALKSKLEAVSGVTLNESISCNLLGSVGGAMLYHPISSELGFTDAMNYGVTGKTVIGYTSSDRNYFFCDGKTAWTLREALDAKIIDENDVALAAALAGLETWNLGDIDLDGKTTVSDVVALRRAIMEGNGEDRYDLDRDEKVSVSDVIALRKIIMA